MLKTAKSLKAVISSSCVTNTCDISVNLECYTNNCNASYQMFGQNSVTISKIKATSQHPGSLKILWTLRVLSRWLRGIKRMFSRIFSMIVLPNSTFFWNFLFLLKIWRYSVTVWGSNSYKRLLQLITRVDFFLYSSYLLYLICMQP